MACYFIAAVYMIHAVNCGVLGLENSTLKVKLSTWLKYFNTQSSYFINSSCATCKPVGENDVSSAKHTSNIPNFMTTVQRSSFMPPGTTGLTTNSVSIASVRASDVYPAGSQRKTAPLNTASQIHLGDSLPVSYIKASSAIFHSSVFLDEASHTPEAARHTMANESVSQSLIQFHSLTHNTSSLFSPGIKLSLLQSLESVPGSKGKLTGISESFYIVKTTYFNNTVSSESQLHNSPVTSRDIENSSSTRSNLSISHSPFIFFKSSGNLVKSSKRRNASTVKSVLTSYTLISMKTLLTTRNELEQNSILSKTSRYLAVDQSRNVTLSFLLFTKAAPRTNVMKASVMSAMHNSTDILTSSFKPLNTISNGDKNKNDFRLIIIGVSVGFGGLFILVVLVVSCCYKSHQRRKAPHLLPYSLRYVTPEKGKDELLASKDSIQMYSNMKDTYRDGFINRGLDSQEESPIALPRTSQLTEPLNGEDKYAYPQQSQLNFDETHLDKLAKEDKHDIFLKVLQPWTDALENKNSFQYKKLKDNLQDSIKDLYRSEKEFRKVRVKGFRPGSVIADICISFTNPGSDPLSRLHKAVASGHLGTLDVDKDFPLRTTGRIRSAESTTYDDILLTPTASVENNRSQSMLLQNGGPQQCSHYLQSSSGVPFEENFHGVFTDIEKPIQKSGKLATYENFQPIELKERETILLPTSTLNGSPMSQEPSLSSGTGSAELILSRDSGYLGSPTSNELFHQDSAILSTYQLPKRKESSQGKNPEPILVTPPMAPRQAPFEEFECSDDPSSTFHVAIHDFLPEDSRELCMKQGEVVTVLNRGQSGWVMVANETNDQGWVPESYLVIVSSSQVATTKQTVETLEYFDSVLEELEETSPDSTPAVSPEMEIAPSVGQVSLCEETKSGNKKSALTINDNSLTNTILTNEAYVALYDFVGESGDELQFLEGERLIVTRKTLTGWWKGHIHDREGWFPSSYVMAWNDEVFGPSISNETMKSESFPSKLPSENVSDSPNEDFENSFQPPERYKGLFVQILKRESAADLAEKFKIEDFLEGEEIVVQASPNLMKEDRVKNIALAGPSRPDRVVPSPPAEGVENTKGKAPEHTQTSSTKVDTEVEVKIKGNPPQKPVPPPPTNRKQQNNRGTPNYKYKVELVPTPHRPNKSEEVEAKRIALAKDTAKPSTVEKNNENAVNTKLVKTRDSVNTTTSSTSIESREIKSERNNQEKISTGIKSESLAEYKPNGTDNRELELVRTERNATSKIASGLSLPVRPMAPVKDQSNITTRKVINQKPLIGTIENRVCGKEKVNFQSGEITSSTKLEGCKITPKHESDKSTKPSKVKLLSSPPSKKLPDLKSSGNFKESTCPNKELGVKDSIAMTTAVSSEKMPEYKDGRVSWERSNLPGEGKISPQGKTEATPPTKPLPAVRPSNASMTLLQSQRESKTVMRCESIMDGAKHLGQVSKKTLISTLPQEMKENRIDNKKVNEKTEISKENLVELPMQEKLLLPAKRSDSKGKASTSPPIANREIAATQKQHFSPGKSLGDNSLSAKPTPAPRRDKEIRVNLAKNKAANIQTRSNYEADIKPKEPQAPSLQARREGEHIERGKPENQIHRDKKKLRTVIKSYEAKSTSELSLEVASTLYELELYTKHGIGYGLLESGKQGYYPLSHVKPVDEKT